jgi:flagellar L-ring protein precursor FlgH
VLSAAGLCQACGNALNEVGRQPHLSSVHEEHAPIHVTPQPLVRDRYVSPASLWQDSATDLFRDPRAQRVGDVVTVRISIKDRASLDNSTNRKREASRDLGLKFDYGLNAGGAAAKGEGSLNPSMTSNTSSKGEGAVSRSETIDLLVAATVTGVLPNGNIIISGRQEVAVNYEMRELSVAGIVRPRDIATDNSISYEKIAEARIRYGGRGRVMEVQQPGWGHQVVDIVSPF